ncbi:nonribosomal peptide synthetase 12 [Pluteus cervinus]|uniref:Nonribosomal peptide synthetase 12 n=1 Tax=Pluteus cervinus TaxID=181527 RepID=A0ACD3AGQ2_9AGAR|nr:nonribosomal peptide synthetase 12 [Pluteus cervinus]
MRSLISSQHLLGSLSTEDQRLFWEYGIGPKVDTPHQSVHQAFEHQARAHPDAVAVEDFEKRITYSALDQQANCFATCLRSMGIIAGSRVCLLVERSIPMVIGILAILKAGGAYVPLDGNVVSDSTLKHALKDTAASVVVVQSKFAHRVTDIPVLCLDQTPCSHPPDVGCAKPLDVTRLGDSAYVIYTSGTTGVPKGVDVSHKNVTNLVCLEPGNLGMRIGVRVSQLMNISFDMAAWETLGSLCNGSTLCLRGKTSKEWRAVMKTVDVVIATPSMLLPHNPTDYPTIKVVAVAGEPCPRATADSWAKHAKFYNCCGPTEITIVNTMYPHPEGGDVRIGTPTPNNNVYVLDEMMQPLPIGEVGLMWAGGAGITKGYLGLPDKTEEKYKRDPFANDGSMMFNTGDLGRWCTGGNLEPLGRVDNQVKIKGFRVELDGVAAAIESYPSVQVAAAILIENELWGFYAPCIATSDEITEAISKIQPYYAVPSQWLGLDDFPKTGNGKTDKRALQKIALDQLASCSSDSDSSTSGPATPITTPIDKDVQISAFSDIPLEVTQIPAAYLPTKSEKDSFSSQSSGLDHSPSQTVTVCSQADLKSLQYPWSGYEDDELPEKTQGKWARNLRHQVFSLYRRLFGVVFIVNMAIFISVIVKGTDAQQLAQIVVANLFCAILMRQDYVINAFFNFFCSVPTSWPLAIRRVCARVYHIGGLHSGCAISGVIWLVLFTAQATKQFLQHEKISVATLAVTYCILAFLLGVVIFAYPSFRSKSHNSFERAHRFLGWTSLALVWCQVVLLTMDYKSSDEHLGHALVHTPPFWMIVVMTGSIILPWLRLRRVPVRAEVLSTHAVRLYFDYTTPLPGSFTRISDNPLMEWHGFATVPEPGKKGYSLVVSKAGDWTNKQITNPPTHLWVRGVPAFGVLRIVPLFRRVIFVATGSGIGPCAPCILERRVPHRLLWTSPNVRQTFGDKLVDSILEASPDAVIYDTRAHGKPDMVKLTYRLVREFQAEAVCIISNQKLTQKVVYGMMSRGIPAFGAIWDS